jgi:hypothetical protein
VSAVRSVRVRASSWAGLFDCAHRWEGEQLLGIRKPTSARALLGKAFHAGTAAFDLARLNRAPITIDAAADAVHDTIFQPDEDVDWSGDALRARDVERIALGLHTLYCAEWSHRYDYEAVELTITPLQIDCGGGLVIELTGTLDRMRARRTTNGRGLTDLKSGRRAVQNGVAKIKGHRAQLGTYEMLYEHTTGLPMTEPAEILGAKTEGKPEIATAQATGCKTLMVGDEQGPGLIEQGAAMLRAGAFPPNPSSPLCDPRFCARWSRCRYHD